MKKLSLVVLTILILTILKINITQGNIIKYYGYNKPTGIATSLVLEIEGPTIPYGEAIIKLKANGVTSRYRLVLITIDVNKSVPDAHLEEFDGTSLGKSYTVKLETDSMVRFIVCGGEGDVVLNADDVTGDDNPLDSTSLLVKFYPPDIEVPFASIALTGTQPIELKIVITVTDNYAVDLERTEYLIIKNGIEITNFLECNMEGDGYKIGTISCSRSLGGLDSGEYTVLATPADQGGNFGTIVSTSFVILEPSTTTTTIAITTTTTPVPTSSTTTSILPQPCVSESLYGEHSKETELLRYLRDNVLNSTPEGQEIIRLYYELSPMIVEMMEEDEEFKAQVKEMIDGVLGKVA